jgi:hypothetical protein
MTKIANKLGNDPDDAYYRVLFATIVVNMRVEGKAPFVIPSRDASLRQLREAYQAWKLMPRGYFRAFRRFVNEQDELALNGDSAGDDEKN